MQSKHEAHLRKLKREFEKKEFGSLKTGTKNSLIELNLLTVDEYAEFGLELGKKLKDLENPGPILIEFINAFIN